MLSLSEFKKLAGKEADNLTDEEIEEVDDVMSQLTDHLFDLWIEDINKDNKSPKPSSEKKVDAGVVCIDD